MAKGFIDIVALIFVGAILSLILAVSHSFELVFGLGVIAVLFDQLLKG